MAPANSTSCRSGVATARRCISIRSVPTRRFEASLSRVVRRVKLRRGRSDANIRRRSKPRERTVVYSSVENGDLRQSRVHHVKTGSESAFPFAMYEQRFSRDGRLIAGESRNHEVIMCESESGRCRPLTPKNDRALTAIAWSGDDTRLFFAPHERPSVG